MNRERGKYTEEGRYQPERDDIILIGRQENSTIIHVTQFTSSSLRPPPYGDSLIEPDVEALSPSPDFQAGCDP